MASRAAICFARRTASGSGGALSGGESSSSACSPVLAGPPLPGV
jgi:hypothetical protein